MCLPAARESLPCYHSTRPPSSYAPCCYTSSADECRWTCPSCFLTHHHLGRTRWSSSSAAACLQPRYPAQPTSPARPSPKMRKQDPRNTNTKHGFHERGHVDQHETRGTSRGNTKIREDCFQFCYSNEIRPSCAPHTRAPNLQLCIRIVVRIPMARASSANLINKVKGRMSCTPPHTWAPENQSLIKKC